LKKEKTALLPMVALLLLALVTFMPTSAYAFNGGGHYWAAEAAAPLFGVRDMVEPIETLMTPDMIDRDREVPLLPELEGVSETVDAYGDGNLEMRRNWDWLREGAIRMDDYDATTLHHFWYAEEGLHEFPNDTYDADNAWETVESSWFTALAFWNGGDLGSAYKWLGYSIHLMQDMGQPAHANEDMHPGDGLSDDDALEDWMSGDYCRANFIWNESDLNAFPGPIIYPIPSNDAIATDMVSAPWVGAAETFEDPFLSNTSLTKLYNMPQVFYYMYYVNQIGNYFASDDEEGNANTTDLIGWLGGFPGFPTQLWDADSSEEDKHVSAQSGSGVGGLADNDGCDCDDDGDLSTIMRWAYGASFRATPGMIDLFRRTVDNVPPDTAVDMTRLDGKPLKEWNNSPVTVKLT
jgi:hypothetical protein